MESITQEMIDEYSKCKDDIVYFAENYIDVNITDSEYKIKFKLFPYQVQVLAEDRVTAKTARQIGFSLMSYVKIVHSIIFNHEKTIIYFSNSRDRFIYSLKRISEIFDLCTLPEVFKPKYITRNKGELRFDNFNVIIGASTISNVRGFTITDLYIEEFDFVKDNIDEFIGVLFPTILWNTCYRMWVWSSVSNGNIQKLQKYLESNKTFNHYNLPWFVIPNRNNDWKNAHVEMIGKEYFDSEYNNKNKVPNG